MTSPEDREIAERFAALRATDARLAPRFDALRRRPPAPARTPWPAAAALAAAVIVTAVVIVRAPLQRLPSLDDAIAQSKALTSWTAPTDALLTVSDLSIPSSVPSLTPVSVALPATATASADTGDSR